MNLLARISAIKAIHDNEFMSLSQYIDALLNAAPAMLEVLGMIREGDAQLARSIIDENSDQIKHSRGAFIDGKQIGFLRRMTAMCAKMEANK